MRRFLLAGAVALCALATGAATASADVDMYVAGGIAKNTSPLTGALQPAYSGSGYTCTTYVPIAAWHDNYALGECQSGWTAVIDDSVYLSEHGGWWYGGTFYGGYNGCGWVDYGITANGGTASTGCAPGYKTEPGAFIANGGKNVWTHKSGNSYDGVTVANSANCHEYGQYYPWSSSAHPAYEIRTIGAGSYLKLRYQAAYNYGGQSYYMVRDSAPGAPASWVFVPASCFPSIPPPGEY